MNFDGSAVSNLLQRMDVISQVQSVTQPVSKDSDISFLPDDEEPDDGTDEPELSQALRELMAQSVS